MKRTLGIFWRIFRTVCVWIVIVYACTLIGQLPSYFQSSKRPAVISTNMESVAFRSLPQVIQDASRAVVLIQVKESENRGFAVHAFQSPRHWGSGVIIGSHHVLTAFHVVRSALGIAAREYLPITVTVKNENISYIATPLEFDANFDLALLETKEELPVCASVAPANLNDWLDDSWFKYEDFYVVGYFSSPDLAVSDRVDRVMEPFSRYIYKKHFNSQESRKKHVMFGETYFGIEVESPNFQGFSGGPVLNPEGQIIGISTRVYGDGGQPYQLRGASAPLIQEFLKVAFRRQAPPLQK